MPHFRAYFARDKQNSSIDYSVLIIEQEQGLPFNAGALKNAGFMLGEEQSDYTCFHDIDYLPVSADYSWPDAPTPLVWFGAETRPVARGQSNYYLRHDLSQFFGAALLVPNELFLAVDGYSNEYWGWGYEDCDLRSRFLARGIALGRRKGTYQALDHVSAGYDLQGKPRAIAEANRLLFEAKRATPMQSHRDGLSTAALRGRFPRARARPATGTRGALGVREGSSAGQSACRTNSRDRQRAEPASMTQDELKQAVAAQATRRGRPAQPGSRRRQQRL